MKLLNFKKPVDLTGYTLVIPSVSVGNVPQLTVDLLITTLKFENVATLWHPGLVASVGADPFYSCAKVVCTACELYINEALKLAAIQLRSTIESKLVLKFLNDLIDGIAALNLKQVYVLGTGFDYELHNIANKSMYYFIANNTSIISEDVIKCTSSKPLERDHSGKLYVSGSGFATKLFEAIGRKIDTVLLMKYVSEGENIVDANNFLSKLLQFLQIQKESVGSLLYPASWRYVYGAPPPLGLF